ncbi:hypothetical protein [Pseudoalteromonas rubra]|uniref:hypothetical protein n=1 Tax=Pseudoalteromonas rubra TaxID=43658 RepID=UPI000F77C343|nr:hypothetical protein [Pseudoalteromonas rubra]
MANRKRKRCLKGLCVAVVMSGLSAGCATSDEPVEGAALLHRYVDNQNGIDGLDNVRRLLFDDTDKVLYAVSADDDALTAYRVGDDHSLTMLDMMSGERVGGMLIGASDMTFVGADRDIQVVSFYSGAVAQFRLGRNDTLTLQSGLSDRIDIQRVFRQGKPISTQEDKLALLGPYAIVGDAAGISYVAANVSQALVQLSSAQGQLSTRQAIRADEVNALGGAVSVAQSDSGQKVAVAGMQANQIALFEVSDSQPLKLQQTLSIGHQRALIEPVFVTFVPGTERLLVADKQSVFAYYLDPQGNYTSSTELKVSDNQKLSAVSRLAFDPAGQCMLAMSESADQVYIFKRHGDTHWLHVSQLDIGGGQAPTSAAFISQDKVAISFAKSDAIQIYTNVCDQ